MKYLSSNNIANFCTLCGVSTAKSDKTNSKLGNNLNMHHQMNKEDAVQVHNGHYSAKKKKGMK